MKMNYFVFGTNDRAAAAAFYDQLLADQGFARIHEDDRMTVWAHAECMFAVAQPYDGAPATNGNGTMLGWQVESPAQVSALYERVIALGGIDAGEPGIRSGRFSAYARDLDNNKLCFFH
ncbi:MAG: VOC family protein [Gammaproteobacteria bacterium]|jgi:predicted lactoylglutathione lyase|nr:VOC family protein [Gammaproteobacteria bacterium]